MIHKYDLLIRLMKREDLDVMVKWINDQDVLEFYEEPPSNLDLVTKKYGPRVEGKHYVVPCIVEYKNEPIGYIEFYEIRVEELEKYGYPINQNIYGIDQFIVETQLWGKGIGTSMIQLMLNYLRNNKGASRVLLEVKNIIIEQFQVIRNVVLGKLKILTMT